MLGHHRLLRLGRLRPGGGLGTGFYNNNNNIIIIIIIIIIIVIVIIKVIIIIIIPSAGKWVAAGGKVGSFSPPPLSYSPTLPTPPLPFRFGSIFSPFPIPYSVCHVSASPSL